MARLRRQLAEAEEKITREKEQERGKLNRRNKEESPNSIQFHSIGDCLNGKSVVSEAKTSRTRNEMERRLHSGDLIAI